MKPVLLMIMLFMSVCMSCRQKNAKDQLKENMMLLDSAYADNKNVILVKAKDTIRIGESKNHFEDNPNIMETDIGAANQTPNRGVHYIKAGDTIRIREPKAKGK